MKDRIWLGIVAIAFATGWGLGRHGDAGGNATDPSATAPGGRRSAMSPAEDRQNREMLARQAAEKFHDRPAGEVADVFSALDPATRGAALEAWIASLGPGNMPMDDQLKLQSLLDAWAKADFEGARRWADGLQSHSIRQLALVGLAGAISREDPHKAFECLISNGPFERSIDDPRISTLMKQLSREAFATGGDALLTLWLRLPEGTEQLSSFTYLELDAGKDADFRSAMDASIDLQNSDHRWPLIPSGMMSRWAEQDPQAATDYLAETLAHRKIGSAMGELREAISQKEGKAAGEQWMLDLFNSIPPEQLPDAIKNSGYASSTALLLAQLPSDISSVDRTRLVAGIIQNALNERIWINDDFLNGVPTAERLEVLRELRGVTLPDPVLEQAKKAGASDSELTGLKEQITRPR